ncbi:MAG: amidohydrolase family protein [Myxococcota bacterium]
MREPIIDADGHVVEPEDLFHERLAPGLRDLAPRMIEDRGRIAFRSGKRTSFWVRARPDSLSAPRGKGAPSGGSKAAVGATDPVGRLADMEVDSIREAVLYPTYGLMIQGVKEPEAEAALCRAVNDWLAEYCAHDPARLHGMGVIPQHNPAAALSEARRCIEGLGFCGVWRRPERIPGTPSLHDPGYESLWSFLEEAGRPLAIHPGLNGLVPCDDIRRRFDDDYASMHAAHFPVELMLALTELTGFGVLDRHPQLRVAFLEGGAAWAPPYLHRLDEHVEVFGLGGAAKLPPSEQFRRQCFVSVEEEEPGLVPMLDEYPQAVMFASDYPHGDGVFPGSTQALLESEVIDAKQKRQVLCDNARRCYGL